MRKLGVHFSWIEILTLLSIIGVLALMFIPSFVRARVQEDHPVRKVTLYALDGHEIRSWQGDIRAYYSGSYWTIEFEDGSKTKVMGTVIFEEVKK
jgi:membrane protein implicated in regulation of membrane protease activity